MKVVLRCTVVVKFLLDHAFPMDKVCNRRLFSIPFKVEMATRICIISGSFAFGKTFFISLYGVLIKASSVRTLFPSRAQHGQVAVDYNKSNVVHVHSSFKKYISASRFGMNINKKK